MINTLLDLVFPKKCLCCNKILYSYNICSDCIEDITYDKNNQNINVEGKHISVLSLFRYKDAVINAIHNFKFNNQPENIKYFGNYLYLYLKDYIIKNKINLIISVPMHRNKYRLRGYNQSEILARRVAKLGGIHYKDILVKNKDHTQLHYLAQENRREEIKGSFSLSRSFLNNENKKEMRILLIDDVFTTGATLKECLGVLISEKVTFLATATLATAFMLEKKCEIDYNKK